MKVIQIGSNRGNDDVFTFVKDKQIDLLILVEPIHFHIHRLQECYKNIKNTYIEQIAIVPEEIKNKIPIYYNVNDGPGYEIASLNKEYTGNESTEFIEVEGRTMSQLFDKYQLTDIDYLFVDAEGYDDVIILSIDFKKYFIKYIEYEHLHLSKQTELINHIESNGYTKTQTVGRQDWNTAYKK